MVSLRLSVRFVSLSCQGQNFVLIVRLMSGWFKSRIFFRFLSHCFWFPSGSLNNYVSLRVVSHSCLGQNVGLILVSVKPWPNGLASRCKFSTCVQLAFHLATHLCWLAMTCNNLRWLWSSSNSYTSQHKFSPFGHPTQVNTSWLQVNCICVKFTAFCDLRKLVSRLANPFGHPSQVHTQVLVLQTCTDLHRLASPFGQGFRPSIFVQELV